MSKMIELIKDNKRISVKTMVYNQSAEWLAGNGDKAAYEVKAMRAGGSTNFKAVFELLQKYLENGAETGSGGGGMLSKLRSAGPKKEAAAGTRKKVFVFFMTDGCDTCNNSQQLMVSKEHLQDSMAKYGEEVVVHVLGFGKNHDDSFLESLSLLGTSDGSYSYVQPTDGDHALEKRLTDLLESTTGLVGKSVFLDLKIENEGGQFLGEWFGDGKSDIVLQAFMQMQGDLATVNTTKFIKLPKGETLRLKINMLRDLKEDTAVIPGNVKKIVVQTDADLSEKEGKMLTLRKLRTCLNLLTAKIGNSMDEGNRKEAEKLVKAWYEIISKYNTEKKIVSGVKKGEDEEVDKLADAVKNGLSICEDVLTERAGEDEVSLGKRWRGAHTTYNIQSKQSHNMLQVKSKAMPRKKEDRSQYQQQQGYMD